MLIGYARVSTSDQNLDLQHDALKSVGCEKTFTDVISGAKASRPGLDKALEQLRDGDTLVVWKLDRLSRSLRDGINTLCDWLERGVRLVSVTQQLDFSGPTGKMIAAVLFAVAEMEQQTRRERQAAGIAVAKENGIYTGRKKGAVKAGIDPTRASQLRNQGLTQKEIANALGVSVASVRRYLNTTTIATV